MDGFANFLNFTLLNITLPLSIFKALLLISLVIGNPKGVIGDTLRWVFKHLVQIVH